MNEIEWIVEMREYPGYFISTKGRIFSEKYNERLEKKPSDNGKGYLYVCLMKEGKQYIKKIHRLVGETFLEKVEGKLEIDHINQNKKDNRVENLRWCNRRENLINRGITSLNTSGVKGVRFRKDRNSWVSRFNIEENKTKSKHFKTKEEAIKWRLEMEKKYY
mgnify:CR=1 FL=1